MGSSTLEWIYIGTVISILVWVGASAWDVERVLEAAPTNSETIKVIAQQWFWTFEHEDGTKEIGELHLKQDMPYRFEITSKDVIHSFNIPDFTVLMDAVPGRINTLWNVFDVPGEYLIQCREYCGLLHYNMRAKLFVEPASVAESTSQAPTGEATLPESTASPAGNQTNQTRSASESSVTLTILEGAAVQGNPAYEPDPLTVKAGDVIAVSNEDKAPHTATSGIGPADPESGNKFDTSIIDPGASAQIDTGDLAAGDYPFYCAVHPYMKATIKVL
ncbi:MAG: cupredoxin domain-containing protein [Nitrososphaeraceae archaeon]